MTAGQSAFGAVFSEAAKAKRRRHHRQALRPQSEAGCSAILTLPAVPAQLSRVSNAQKLR